MLRSNIKKARTRFMILTAVLLFSAFFLFIPQQSAQAQGGVDPGVDVLRGSGLTTTDVRTVVAKVIKAFLGLLGTIALALIVYGGYVWMTSEGDSEKVSYAKDLLKNAAIGLAIILAAYAIVTFIFNLLMKAMYGGGDEAFNDVSFGRGALGAGIIQSHYPPRDAKDIPRNTAIIITFKVPMNLDSIAYWPDTEADGTKDWNDEYVLWKDWNDTDGNGKVDGGETYKLENDNGDGVKGGNEPYIYAFDISFTDADGNIHQFDGHVYTIQSEFNTNTIKTIVIVPDENLGSPNEDIWHTVKLKEQIRTQAGGYPFNPVNYQWKFQTNRTVDMTPPYLVGMEIAPPNYAHTPSEDNPNYWDANQPYNGKRVNASVIPFASATTQKCDGIEQRGDRAPFDGEIKEVDGEFVCETWPRNVLVQINFSEAVNPVTTAGRDSFMGVYKYKGTPPSDAFYEDPLFDPLVPKDWEKVPGEFKLSSDYRTAEFWPDLADGTNSCGDTIYILPGNAILRAYMKSGTAKDPDPSSPTYSPQVTPPWDGIVDVASNGFDGNADGYLTTRKDMGEDVLPCPPCTGDTIDDPQVFPPHSITVIDYDMIPGNNTPKRVDHDDFIWIFDTSDEIDVTSPFIIRATPRDGKTYADLDEPYIVEFNKFMSFTTFTPNDTFSSRASEDNNTNWIPCGEPICPQGSQITYVAGKSFDYDTGDLKPYDHSGATAYHELFAAKAPSPPSPPPPNEYPMLYNPIVSKRIKDLFQNCYEGECKEGTPDIRNPQVDVYQGVDDDYTGGAIPPPNPNNPLTSDCTAYKAYP